MKTKLLILFGVFCIAKTSADIYQAEQKQKFKKEMENVFIKNNIPLNDPDVQLILLYSQRDSNS